MLKSRAILLGLLISALVLGTLSFLSTITPSYNYCQAINEQPNGRDETEEPQYIVSAALVFLECEGAFVDSNVGSLTLLATLGVVFFTFTLWFATQSIVEGAERTAERQLRAYVGLGTKGFYSTTDQSVERPKVQITNWGATPAKNVTIWRKIIDSPPCIFSYEDGEFIARNIMIQPKQDLHLFWGERMSDREGKFLYGYIDYSDIYGRRWRSLFAYQHRHGTWYVNHCEHNDEIELKPAPHRAGPPWRRLFGWACPN